MNSNDTVEIGKRLREFEEIGKRLREFNEIEISRQSCCEYKEETFVWFVQEFGLRSIF